MWGSRGLSLALASAWGGWEPLAPPFRRAFRAGASGGAHSTAAVRRWLPTRAVRFPPAPRLGRMRARVLALALLRAARGVARTGLYSGGLAARNVEQARFQRQFAKKPNHTIRILDRDSFKCVPGDLTRPFVRSLN